MRCYLKVILEKFYNVAEASDGNQGYDLACKLVPDLILSDLMMPICDGIAFCRKIRADRSLKHIPFVLLSANSDAEAQTESFGSGVDGYLTKPFDEAVLSACLQSVIKNREIQRRRSDVEQEFMPESKDLAQPDKVFMNEVLAVLERNYADSDFGVKEWMEMLHVSYAVIYKLSLIHI